jgi:hypothetical protein
MNEPIVVCPTCKTEIKLTESLALPLIEATRKEYELRIRQIQTDMSSREADIVKQRTALAKEKEGITEQVTLRLNAERTQLSAEEARKARLLVASDLDQKAKEVADLQEVLKERDAKLGEAQKAQAELIRKQRELDDAKREMALTIEKKVQESLSPIRDKARKDAEDQLKLKVLEKEQTISSMQEQIEELKRRAEQGSQQLQGEVLELELEATLRAQFPRDMIEPVPKGEFGGDVLHHVLGQNGQRCGTILWETKRTKNWSDGWLSKLREDQRTARAEIAVIISKVLPRGIETFELREDIWVAEPRYAVPIASVLRQSLIELASARHAVEGQHTKMELLYHYLTGPRFRQRIEAIVERFSDMENDLDKERKAITRLWSKREEQIRCMVGATAGMYGDLQGIAGRTLREVEGLEFETPEAVEPQLPAAKA